MKKKKKNSLANVNTSIILQKEAETKVKLLSKKLQASGSTLSDTRVILDRLIKDHGDEVPPLGR